MRYTTRIIVPPRVRRSGPPGSPGGAYGPQVLGVRKTLGFGDRLGVAGAAHIAVAAAHPEFAPVFAQQSIHDMTVTARTPADVVGSAARAVSAARFRQPWGADADRLHTAQEVTDAAEAGYTCFTFDPCEMVAAGVSKLSAAELQSAVDALVAEGDLPDHWAEPYLDRTINLSGNHRLRIEWEPLQRAVVRYLPAVVHCARMASALARSNQGRPFEIEVALDAVDAPASTLEHLFIGLELEARGVRLTGLALRYAEDPEGTGEGEQAVGDLEQALREHAAVAEFCGPYKLCFYETVDPLKLYPIIGRVCGEALHVKITGASYLEALRIVAQVDPTLFQEIASYSLSQPAVGVTSKLGVTQAKLDELRADVAGGSIDALLNNLLGRRCLDATFGAVLTASRDATGRPFKETILALLDEHADLYSQAIGAYFDRHIEQLTAG